MLTIVLLGPPGVGKGTQGDKILQQYPLVPIALGNLLREHLHQGTTLKAQIEPYMNTGKLVPDELVTALAGRHIEANQAAAGLLFDGFPRTCNQAVSLDNLLVRCNRHIDGVFFLEAPETVLKQRIRSRAKASGRVEDQDEEKIATRIELYWRETVPVADYYKQQQKLFTIPSIGPIETIYAHIAAGLEQLIAQKKNTVRHGCS